MSDIDHNLSSSASVLTGVGPRILERLKRIHLYTVGDILFHLPYRYIDRTRLHTIASLVVGQAAYLQGEIKSSQVRYGRRRYLLCRISDGSGEIVLRFFYFSRTQQDKLAKGCIIRCYGMVRHGSKTLEMVHPEYRILNESNSDLAVEASLTPVYRTTEGLQQGRLRDLTGQALAGLSDGQLELLPGTLLADLNMMDLASALRYVHRPPANADIAALQAGEDLAQQRLSFEELLAHYLSLRLIRERYRRHKGVAFSSPNRFADSFLKNLPFTLTTAQQRAYAILCQDLQADTPMLRLLQGDVGSGKTVVSALVALYAIANGYQVAMMVPTELLAEQHFNHLHNWFTPLSIPVFYLSGKLGKQDRAEQLACFSGREPVVAVGTHALFQDTVRFGRLGLVIIDEQHRFGVSQRLALLEKGKQQGFCPHQLVMTATPIPRTLAMTAYADLDLVVIDELPPNRKKVNTVVFSNAQRDLFIERIARVCKQGRQVYWVCTMIDGSESLACQAAIDTQQQLQQRLLGQGVGLVHGRMKGEEKEQVMQRFKLGEIQVLVATTVIEVGIDIPNASLMVIENAERLGLAQLHQLRGRVGRGSAESDCVLLYQAPLSKHARHRLEIMRNTTNGFKLAEQDLALRGPGELLGERQTGLANLRIADLSRDQKLLQVVYMAADRLLQDYRSCIDPLVRRWLGGKVHYGDV